ncbi:MAG: cytidine deaminase [Myxococcota bacterium]
MPKLPWKELFDAAAAVRTRAYAPYSSFQVGAAALADDGSIHTGCNVENASYGLGVCAERNAIARMVAEGRKKLVAVMIVIDTSEPTPPCGACRQVMAELGGPDLAVASRNLEGQEARWTLKELLPFAFTKDFL